MQKHIKREELSLDWEQDNPKNNLIITHNFCVGEWNQHRFINLISYKM
jgi:hypothetical protein